MLRKYMSDRGKIRSRRVTGNCAQHQRALALAIKTAREMVLLPYTQRTVTERPGGRGGGRDRGERGERAERTLSDTIGSEAPRDREADTEYLSAVETELVDEVIDELVDEIETEEFETDDAAESEDGDA
jgi:hypothetical protein